MKNDLSMIFEKILTLIDYQDDKKAFIAEFMGFCLQKSLIDYLTMLPEARKHELQHILQEKDPAKVQELLEPYIATEEFTKLLQENTQKLFQDYCRTILPTLSEEQKNSLENYFSSLMPEQSSIISRNG